MDKIMIPIHAFPVIGVKDERLFPEVIDLGKNCKVG